jgi:WD40 repeat protein/serine/threonine protein kinase
MNEPAVGEDASLESLVGQVANEFLERRERGERPEVDEYAARYPQAAPLIRKVLASLEMLSLSLASHVEGTAEDAVTGTLGDFRLLREVGRGGMGVVYEAEQISLGRRVALKVLPFAATMDRRNLQRFHNEAQAAAGLHHTNIVPVHYVGCERGVHFYAMQFIEGQTLAQVIADLRLQIADCGIAANRPQKLLSGTATKDAQPALCNLQSAMATTAPVAALSTERSTQSPGFFRRVAHLGVQAAEALEHAHQLGVVHRDIKPANLLIQGEPGASAPGVRLWITDFGLARLGTDPGLTMTGDLVGTVRYMSPEQALAKRVPVDHRTDVYSLGVTLYELLMLEPAYTGKNREEVLRQIAFEEPRPPRRLNKAVPVELETIVLKAMAKNPEERYATAQELADDLQRYLEDKPIKAKRPSLRQRAQKWARRHKAVVRAAVVVSVLAVAGLAAGTVLVMQEQARTAEARAQATTDLAAAEAAARNRLETELYFQRIALADREWSANNLGRMEQLLDQCPRHLRGWEWHYLKGLRRPGLRPLRHEAAVLCAAFSPGGERIASGSQDGVIKLWDAGTGQELHSFRPHQAQVWSVVFSPDGRRLASGGRDRTVNVWDLRTVQPRLVWKKDTSEKVLSVAFSPDGQFLATGGGDGQDGSEELILWEAATARTKWSFRGRNRGIKGLAFHPDGRLLASRTQDGYLKVWDVQTGREPLSLGRHKGSGHLAFNPDGSRLALTSGDGRGNEEVEIWDWQAGQKQLTLRGHISAISGLAFGTDGRRLATGGIDQTIKIWDAATGQEALTLRAHQGGVMSVVFSRDGHHLVSAGMDQTVRVWDARPWQDGETGQEFLTLRGHALGVKSVAFHPQGGLLASGSVDGTVKLWDTQTWKEHLPLDADTDTVSAVAFSPDGKWLAAGDHQGKKVKVWQIDPMRAGRGTRLVHDLLGQPRHGILSVAFSPDSKLLAAAGWSGGMVRVWDLATGKEGQQLKDHDWGISSVAFSPDGRYLASAGFDTTVRVWDVAAGQEIACLEPRHKGPVTSVTFSADGNLLVSASEDRTVRLWEKGGDAKTWKPLRRLSDPAGGVLSVAISPLKDLRLAWGGMDGTVKVWDQNTGKTHVLRGHTSWVESVAFSPDGKYIASGSRDETVKIWKTPPSTGGR